MLQPAHQYASIAPPAGLFAVHSDAMSVPITVCCDLVEVVNAALHRAEAHAAAQQLQAAQFEAADGSAIRAQLQRELSSVEARRQQSQAQSVQAEQLVQQLQVRTTCTSSWLLQLQFDSGCRLVMVDLQLCKR